MLIKVSGGWCMTAASLARTFSPPPIQSFTAPRPLLLQDFSACKGEPPTWITKGVPESASSFQKGSSSICPGAILIGERCGTQMASRLPSNANSSSFIASAGESRGITPTPIKRSSSEQKSIMCLLCARVAP